MQNYVGLSAYLIPRHKGHVVLRNVTCISRSTIVDQKVVTSRQHIINSPLPFHSDANKKFSCMFLIKFHLLLVLFSVSLCTRHRCLTLVFYFHSTAYRIYTNVTCFGRTILLLFENKANNKNENKQKFQLIPLSWPEQTKTRTNEWQNILMREAKTEKRNLYPDVFLKLVYYFFFFINLGI